MKRAVAAVLIGGSLLLCNTQGANAGAVVGATEFTQIANNLELIMQYKKQVEGVAEQVKMYKKQVEALRRLDAGKLESLRGGINGVMTGQEILEHIAKIDELDGVLSNVGKNMRVVAKEGEIAVDVANILRSRGKELKPRDYLSMMKALSELQRETYQERVRALNKAATDTEHDIERMNRIVALAPEISTNVEGLGAIVQTNGIMVSQMAGLKQSMAAAASMNAETASLLSEEANNAEMQRMRSKQWQDEWLKGSK